MSKKSKSKRFVQQGKDAVQPANETEGLSELKQNSKQRKSSNRGDSHV